MFNTKNLLKCMGWAGLVLTLSTESAFAQLVGGPLGGVGIIAGIAPAANSPIVQLMGLLASINTFMHIVLMILLNLLQYLLQADFLNDPMMMGSLNKIWVLSRNIMNVIFAIMLVGVAIYTIITAKGDFIKGKISTFIVAVIFVNFSWFFPRVIIDVANVLTATVYSVPGMLPGFRCRTYGNQPCTVIVNQILFPANQAAVDDWKDEARCTDAPNTPGPNTCSCDDKKNTKIGCYAISDYPGTGLGGAHAMINGMLVSFINIHVLTQLPVGVNFGAGAASFSSVLRIMINIMMAFVTQFAVMLALLGLAVGLFIRILILWLTIAFMPFVFLGYVITGKLGTNIFGFETDIWKEFINAAFLPAVVGIPMTIGFIMLSVMAPSAPPPGFPLQFGFSPLQGIPTWWAMLWMGAAVSIIYVGAFAALARSKITGKITEKIKGFGDTLFGAAIQLPLLTPLPIPAAGGGQVRLGQALNLGNNLRSQIQQQLLPAPPRGAQGAGAPAVGVGGAAINPGAVNAAAVNALNGHAANHLVHNDLVLIQQALKDLSNNTLNAAQHAKAFKDITDKIGGSGLPPGVVLTELQKAASAPGHALEPQLGNLTAAITRIGNSATP
jgi:hypothetical protein